MGFGFGNSVEDLKAAVKMFDGEVMSEEDIKTFVENGKKFYDTIVNAVYGQNDEKKAEKEMLVDSPIKPNVKHYSCGPSFGDEVSTAINSNVKHYSCGVDSVNQDNFVKAETARKNTLDAMARKEEFDEAESSLRKEELTEILMILQDKIIEASENGLNTLEVNLFDDDYAPVTRGIVLERVEPLLDDLRDFLDKTGYDVTTRYVSDMNTKTCEATVTIGW